MLCLIGLALVIGGHDGLRWDDQGTHHRINAGTWLDAGGEELRPSDRSVDGSALDSGMFTPPRTLYHRALAEGFLNVTPTPVPDVPLAAPVPPAEALPVIEAAPHSTAGLFFDGYRDGGAPYPEGRIDAMVWCESSWRIDPGGYHLGLAQFDPGSWATVSAWTGLSDWRDPYHQGYNVAAWAAVVSPGTSAGWPYCWWVW